MCTPANPYARLLAVSCLLFAAALPACSQLCEKAAASSRDSLVNSTPAVQSTDFDTLVDHRWSGTLTYLDYTSAKNTTIRSTLRVRTAQPASGIWTIAIGYDDEPHANAASELRLIDAGTAIKNGDTTERVISRSQSPDAIEIVTEHAGTDDQRPATIRKTYRIAAKAFSIVKRVKFAGSDDFIQRHEYRWTR
ncbi:MAG: hypothetical protein IBJ18_01175 [Phycisphaerales bacterium]|nr:hypothetical protein [Phycisphaerales bacterium]